MRESRLIFLTLIICLGLIFLGWLKSINSPSLRADKVIEGRIEEDLSIIDGTHSANNFLSILNTIKEYYSEYTLKDIGNYIAYAYQEVNKKLPDITLYEVAQDMKEMIISSNGRMKLNEIIATYIILKPKGY